MYTYSTLPFQEGGKSWLEKKTVYLLNMKKPGHAPLPVMRYYRIIEPQNHRGWMCPLEITLPKSKSKCSFPTFIIHRKASIWVLNIVKEGESTTSLGNLFYQCSADLTVSYSSCLYETLYVAFFACYPFSCHCASLKRDQPNSFDCQTLDIYKQWWEPLCLLQVEQLPVSHPFLIWEMLKAPNCICGPLLDFP